LKVANTRKGTTGGHMFGVLPHVAEGSVLGRLFFNALINDLNHVI